MQDSLPAGGLRLCRAGVEPAGSLREVSDHLILLPRAFPGAIIVRASRYFRTQLGAASRRSTRWNRVWATAEVAVQSPRLFSYRDDRTITRPNPAAVPLPPAATAPLPAQPFRQTGTTCFVSPGHEHSCRNGPHCPKPVALVISHTVGQLFADASVLLDELAFELWFQLRQRRWRTLATEIAPDDLFDWVGILIPV